MFTRFSMSNIACHDIFQIKARASASTTRLSQCCKIIPRDKTCLYIYTLHHYNARISIATVFKQYYFNKTEFSLSLSPNTWTRQPGSNLVNDGSMSTQKWNTNKNANYVRLFFKSIRVGISK